MNRKRIIILISALIASPLIVWHDLPIEFPGIIFDEAISSLDMSFYEWAERRPITNWAKDKLKDMPPFIRDTKLTLQLRTYYFFQEDLDRSYKEAWAAGGWLEYQSGCLCNLLGVSATVYASQPLYAPDGRDGTKLLAPVRRVTPCSASSMADIY